MTKKKKSSAAIIFVFLPLKIPKWYTLEWNWNFIAISQNIEYT